jgi:hypothetical protein
MWAGHLLHIHICPQARAPMVGLEEAELAAGVGIAGDRYATGRGTYSQIPDIREVTLIEIESLQALARDHGVTLPVDQHRRNLTVEGVPLNHLVGRRFRVGEVVLEGGRLNTPCKYLDLVTGLSVCDLLVHRSGLNARIVQGGRVRPGDRLEPV